MQETTSSNTVPESDLIAGRASSPRLCIVVADEHPLIRVGVAVVLAEHLGAAVTQVGSLDELHQVLATGPHDVLLLDLTLSGGSALQAIPQLRQHYPDLPILVLSAHPECPSGVEAILAGAHGYLSKSCSAEELVEAVQHLVKGGRYINPELGQALANYLVSSQTAKQPPHKKLSPREHTVLMKITEGFTTVEIAKALGLNQKTVGTHRSRILQKMHIHTTAGLTRYVVENNLTHNQVAV